MSVTQLANALALTPGGVRQQLAQLESSGTIVHSPGPGGRGRFFYSLAPVRAGNTHSSYHRFVVRLLQAIEAQDAGIVGRAAVQIGPAPETTLAEGTLAARLRAVQRVLDEEGFAAEVEARGDSQFALRLQVCPVAELATEFGSLCEAEEQCLLRWLTGLRVVRDEWRLGGADECCYVVSEGAATG